MSPDSRRAYVTNLHGVNGQFEGYLAVIDVASRSRLATIPFGLKKTYGVAASPDGSRLYVVTSTDAGSLRAVTVLDAVTYGVITETTLPGTAFGSTVSLSPDGRFAYFPRQPNTSQAPGIVDVLDTTTNTIVATTTVSNNPRSAAVSPNGAIVYVASSQLNGGSLHRLDPSTHASLGTTAMVAPIAVAFRADSSRAYVAAVDKVYVVDTATHAVAATIPIPSRLLDNSVGNRIAAIVTTPPPFRSTGLDADEPERHRHRRQPGDVGLDGADQRVADRLRHRGRGDTTAGDGQRAHRQHGDDRHSGRADRRVLRPRPRAHGRGADRRVERDPDPGQSAAAAVGAGGPAWPCRRLEPRAQLDEYRGRRSARLRSFSTSAAP